LWFGEIVLGEGHWVIEKRYYSVRRSGSATLKKCYCGFVCEGVEELKAHILKVHGARDGDWRTWEER